MAWEITYRCDRCEDTQRVRTGDYRFYDVPGRAAGASLFEGVPCSDETGWCRRCRRLRPIELIPDPSLLLLMKEEASHAVDIDAEERSRRLARIDARIRWREARTSPPKCLACGSTEVEAIDRTNVPFAFAHPDCGGVLRIVEDPSHIQPMKAFLIPAEGPRARPRLAWPPAWFRRRTPRP